MATSFRRLAEALTNELASRLSTETRLPWAVTEDGLVAEFGGGHRARFTLDFTAGPHARPVKTSWDYVNSFGPEEFGYRFQGTLRLESARVGEMCADLFGQAASTETFAIACSTLVYGRFLKASPLQRVMAADAPGCYEVLQPLLPPALAVLESGDFIWTAAERLLAKDGWGTYPCPRISLAVLARGRQAGRDLAAAEIEELQSIGRRTGIPRRTDLFERCLAVLASDS